MLVVEGVFDDVGVREGVPDAVWERVGVPDGVCVPDFVGVFEGV